MCVMASNAMCVCLESMESSQPNAVAKFPVETESDGALEERVLLCGLM